MQRIARCSSEERPCRALLVVSVLVTCVLVLAARSGSAQQEGALVLRVSSLRTEILPCEPFVLDIEVRNAGDSVVQFPEILTLGFDGLRIQVTEPGGLSWRYVGLGDGLSVEGVPNVTLHPGGVYRYRALLHYSAHGRGRYAFPRPGHYELSVTYAPFSSVRPAGDEGPKLEAKPIKVTVLEPEGRDAEALELFKRMERPRSLLLSGKELPEELQKLAEEYGETPYGRYARYSLAYRLLNPNFGRSETNYRKAAPMFEELAGEEPPFPLADQCLFYLAECYEYTGRKRQAVEVLQKLLEDFPLSPVAEEAQNKLAALQETT